MKRSLVLNLVGYTSLNNNSNNIFNVCYLKNLTNLFSSYKLNEVNYKNDFSNFNLEIGQKTFSSGKNFYNGLDYLEKLIDLNEFYKNEEFNNDIKKAYTQASDVHIFLTISSCKFNSLKSLISLLKLLSSFNISYEKLFIHLIMQKDSLKNQIDYLEQLNSYLLKTRLAKLASITGANYVLDSSYDYYNLEQGYDFYTLGLGAKDDLISFIKRNQNGLKDLSNLKPTYFENEFKKVDDSSLLIFFDVENLKLDNFLSLFTNNGIVKHSLSIYYNFEPKRKYSNLTIYSFTNNLENYNGKYYFSNLDSFEPLSNKLKKRNLRELLIFSSLDSFFAHDAYLLQKKINVDSLVIKTNFDDFNKTLNDEVEAFENNFVKYNYNFCLLTFSSLYHTFGIVNKDKLISYLTNIDNLVGKLYNYCMKNDICFNIISTYPLYNENKESKLIFFSTAEKYKIKNELELSDVSQILLNYFNE